MDPISITGLVIEVSHVLASLVEYAKAVQSASSEVRRLSEELFALKGILDHLAIQTEQTHCDEKSSESLSFDGDVMSRVLYTTNELIRTLLADLEPPETKFKHLKRNLKWPFTQKQVSEHLVRLERVKSWLILVLMTDHHSADHGIQQEINDLTSALKEDLRIRDRERNRMANRELLQWMAPVSPESAHLRASKRYRMKTGNWFLSGHLMEFLKTEENPLLEDNRALFLLGKSGTGKTTLFAQTADKLTSMSSQDPSICVAYFYCTIGDQASQVARNVLGSLVAQLSGVDPTILTNIWSTYNKVPKSQAHRFPVEISLLETAILKCASQKTQVILLVDAVNESKDMDLIEESLLRLANSCPNIRVLITTTNTLVSTYRGGSVLNISREMRGDIDIFIRWRLQTDDTLKSLTPKFQSEIEKTLLRNADSSFRWVQLSLDNLSTQRSIRAMREALRSLPVTLRETYANTLERIAPADWNIAREALFWISFAKKPLTLSRLNEIVVLDEEDKVLDEDMMLVPPHILPQICQGLITEDQDGCVTLAHSSVKDFLTSDWIRSSRVNYFCLDPTTADLKIMNRCLTYLCLDNFANGYNTKNHLKLRDQHPFLTYAANYWPEHGDACQFGDLDMVHKLFETRFLPGRGNYATWLQTLFRQTVSREQDRATINNTHPLYYASSFGMVPVVKSILEDPNIDVNAPGGRVGATSVWIASLRFNYEVVEILLAAGADPTIRDPGSGLHVLDLLRMVPTVGRNYNGLRPILAKPAPWKEKVGN
ncbi:unnamed protein product [Penicillium salamii]|uniref:NACHT domain-containing protein n=1 Tax=Penicillium salamii TaxID=1612424 RepID=A0A9W4IJP7_9EURO|nr:unnamed protein product [Penicillium salamii]CAG8011173.1 unnamed protein product [Penicillium salamii]CAG8068657.1 unnamed protein product [Penicillium salamii]CAG8252360.1 unnamed protein product [Penicillium salamii]CAG8311181.1 unnamed protein product [Penicillium salamii]